MCRVQPSLSDDIKCDNTHDELDVERKLDCGSVQPIHLPDAYGGIQLIVIDDPECGSNKCVKLDAE